MGVCTHSFSDSALYKVPDHAVADLFTDRDSHSVLLITASFEYIHDEKTVPVRPALPVGPSVIS